MKLKTNEKNKQLRLRYIVALKILWILLSDLSHWPSIKRGRNATLVKISTNEMIGSLKEVKIGTRKKVHFLKIRLQS